MRSLMLIIAVSCFKSAYCTTDKKTVFGLFHPDKRISMEKALLVSKYVSSGFEVSPSGGFMNEGEIAAKWSFMDYYTRYVAIISYPRYKYGIRPGNREGITICYVSCYNDEDIKQRSIGFCWEGDSLIAVVDTYFNPPDLSTPRSRKTIMEIITDSLPTLHIPINCVVDTSENINRECVKYCHIVVTIPESEIRVLKRSAGKEDFNANIKRSVSRRLKGKIRVDEEFIDHTFYESETGCTMSHEIVLRDEFGHYVLVTFYYNNDKVMYAEIDYLKTDN